MNAINVSSEKTQDYKEYKGIKGIFLSPKATPPKIKERPYKTEDHKILDHVPITQIKEDATRISLCQNISPYTHTSLMEEAGFSAQLATAHTHKNIQTITIQPRFSGLLGPSISFMSNDFTNAVRDKTGSAAEIIHNTHIAPRHHVCKGQITGEFDIEYRGHYDLFDSDKAPLYRLDAIFHNRLHLGQNFLASAGLRVSGQKNLTKDDDLSILDKNISVAQDEKAFAYTSGVDHATLNGFFTLKPYLYLSAQLGYLNEKFAGFGSEILYRPYRQPWAIGFDVWHAYKRSAKDGSPLQWYNEPFTSTFINAWYDMPDKPVSFGLSLGQFLDGDWGGEIKSLYKPASGWKLEGFSRFSNESDKSLNKDKKTNITAGLRLTMPLEQFRSMPYNSRATIDISPFGQDKRQRVHNQYPLYDLTDPWSAQNIYLNWRDVIPED